jgi:hypothetical protein
VVARIRRRVRNSVFEIACKFQVTQADAMLACPSTSYHNAGELPRAGRMCAWWESYGQDSNYEEWVEIHAVSSIEALANPQGAKKTAGNEKCNKASRTPGVTRRSRESLQRKRTGGRSSVRFVFGPGR